jgi:hypothetical protein
MAPNKMRNNRPPLIVASTFDTSRPHAVSVYSII